jgi:hypothetical protein
LFDAELLKALVPLAAALLAWFVAAQTWYRQRGAERAASQKIEATKFVTPFLFATEDLQSRLYNISALRAERILSSDDQFQAFAKETLYLFAHYFYFEMLVLQYTSYGSSAEFLTLAQRVRARLSEASSASAVDAWCLFRPRQRGLGRAAADPQSTVDNPAAMSLIEFVQMLDSGVLAPLELQGAVRSFEDKGRLSAASYRRLARVQNAVVDVVEYLEQDFVAHKARPVWRGPLRTSFTLFVGSERSPRKRAHVPEAGL